MQYKNFNIVITHGDYKIFTPDGSKLKMKFDTEEDAKEFIDDVVNSKKDLTNYIVKESPNKSVKESSDEPSDKSVKESSVIPVKIVK